MIKCRAKARNKIIALILSVLSIVFTLGSMVENFTDFNYYGHGRHDGLVWECLMVKPDLYFLTEFIFKVVPIVLLILYICRFYEKLKFAIIMPLVYFMYGVYWYGFNLIRGLVYHIPYYDRFLYRIAVLMVLYCVMVFILCVPSKYVLRLIVASLIVISEIDGYYSEALFVYNDASFWIREEFYLFLITDSLAIAGRLFFSFALFFFVAFNPIPSAFGYIAKNKRMIPEAGMLKQLSRGKEIKVISESDYAEKKSEILKKM